MIYLKVVAGIIVVMCVTYSIFRPIDVLNWWWDKSKNVVIGIFNLIKKWVK